MKTELLITSYGDQVLSMQVMDGKIVQIHAETRETSGEENAGTLAPVNKLSEQHTPRVGDIYVGKVRNIVKNINAAFVEFSKGQMGYLPLNEKIVPLHTQGFPFQEGRVLIGDEIIVQVAKEPVKTKPVTLTGMLDLAGRYMVLTVGKDGVGLSKKIKEKDRREFMRALMEEYAQEGCGMIARTNSVHAEEKELRRELEWLKERYQQIVTFGMHKAPFTCLEKAPAAYLCDIRDGYGEFLESIITDDDTLYQEIEDYLINYWPEGLTLLRRWNPDHGKLDAVYNISRTIDHALMPKVWLKSGAYLVIQPTEALVSIDVNTGKAVSKKKDVQATYRKVNLEAAEEIARQLRLRNLSGMILIDFIDMKSEESNEELLEALRRHVRQDSVPTTVVDMTKLGLVEMTRKKVRMPLYQQLIRNKE